MINDTELLDWMDNNGVQIWPVRDKHASDRIVGVVVQVPSPFIQIEKPTLRLALWAAIDSYEKMKGGDK